MKRTPSFFLFIVSGLFLLFWTACSEIEAEPDFGYDYYPLEIGRSWTYQVDSITFKDGGNRIVKDSTHSFLREVIVDTTTLSGELLYITERYYRPTPNDPWRIAKVFTRSRSKEQAFQTEDNLQFVKMVFPVTEGKRWDGHVYFDATRTFQVGGGNISFFNGWNYQIKETGGSLTVGNQQFEDVVAIQQANSTDILTEYRVAMEQYARNTGLIYREWFIADTQCKTCCGDLSNDRCITLPWEEKAEKGLLLRQTLIAHN